MCPNAMPRIVMSRNPCRVMITAVAITAVVGMGDHVPAFILRPVPGNLIKSAPGLDAEQG